MGENKLLENKSEALQEVKYVPAENNEKLRPELVNKKTDTLFLYASVLTAQLLVMVCGSAAVWTSPCLIKLASNDTAINPVGRPITTLEVSMIAGLPSFTSLAGTLLLPKLSDYIGRKRHLLLMGFLSLLFSGALAFSNTIIYIVISKSLLGLILQGAWTVTPIFIAEISEDHNRAKFGCLVGLSHQIGHFYGYVLGPIFSITNFTLISTAPALIFIICFTLVPESPIYLLLKDKDIECKKALKKFRNNKSEKEIELDLATMKLHVKAKTEAKKSNVLSLFKKRENRFALLLALLPLLVQHCSGVAVMMGFLAPIFNSAGTSISGDTVAVIVSLVKISCFTFTSMVVEKFGRRRMLLISAAGSGTPLFAMGLYFYLQHINSPLIDHLQWLPITGILSFVILYSMGLGPIPMAIISELFPSDLRAASSTVINTTVALVIFTLTSGFPIISEVFGTHWCMWLFSSSCFIGFVLIYLFLPETKGKSFGEIQKMLKKY